jgi:hypothetical protein
VSGEGDALFHESNGPPEPDPAAIKLEILAPTGDPALDLFKHPRTAASLIGSALFATDEPFPFKDSERKFATPNVDS